jgi:hypothetical protein
MSRRAKDAGDVNFSYPVLDERPLPYIPRKLLRGARRSLSDLPETGPGSVLVFRHGTRYVVFDEARHLTGAEEPVVDATAVYLVDKRRRDFTIYLTLPSTSPADDFTIRATFRARVTNAERAAEEGPIDITGYLGRHLEQDPKLAKLGSDYSVEAIAKVRDLIISRIEAYCELNPVDLPALAVELASATVLTPRELRRHEQDKRDERRRQELAQLQADGEDRSIERHESLVKKGSGALTALGLTRGETSASDAIANARDDEKRQQDQFAEAFRILQQTGAADIIDIDPTDMVIAYLEKLTGQPVSRPQRDGLRGRDSGRHEAIGSDSGEEDEEPPDEAGLDE